MKLVLVCNNNLFLFPFLTKYLSSFEKVAEYRIVFWNRDKSNYAHLTGSYIQYKKKCRSFFWKIINYFGFINFAKSIINKEKPDFVVVFNTQTAILLFRFLLKKKIPYIFDYRDESHEKHFLYKKLVEKCINKSVLTVFSSPGFLLLFNNINKANISICHNNKFDHPISINRPIEKTRVTLSFWGMIRYCDYFKKIINKLGNDSRFNIVFYGKNDLTLKKYVSSNHFNNIAFKGPYNEDEITTILSSTDLVINAYPNNSIQKNSLTCKMYEALCANLAMIVQKDSFMYSFLSERGYPVYPYECDAFDPNILYKWFFKINYSSIANHSKLILDEVANDNSQFSQKVLEVISKKYELS